MELDAACTYDESLTPWNITNNSLQAIHVTKGCHVTKGYLETRCYTLSTVGQPCDSNYYLQWAAMLAVLRQGWLLLAQMMKACQPGTKEHHRRFYSIGCLYIIEEYSLIGEPTHCSNQYTSLPLERGSRRPLEEGQNTRADQLASKTVEIEQKYPNENRSHDHNI
ncbi:uncharacterized protein [Asterias amurensis]|uniref:uncharacterized protein isoform X2 n=1 Tax=Asterias amurensis TaxID=7602 RepID=UPI003AB266D3